MMLEAVGVCDLEEDLYKLLLGSQAGTASELAASVGASPARVRRALGSLEVKGLVTRLPGRDGHFVPAAPDIAVEALVQDRLRELNQLRADAAELLIRFHQGVSRRRRDPQEFVEVVRGSGAVYQRFKQVEGTARQEVVMLNKPPYVHLGLNDLELQQLSAGVDYRTIYDRTALDHQGQIDWIAKQIAAGEHSRVLSGLPMKLVIADRRVAVVPLYVNDPSLTEVLKIEEALIIHPGSLLDALQETFEALWRQSVPIRSLAGGRVDDAGTWNGSPSDQDRRILVCLSAGLKDETIARQMGMGARTVQRRIRRLMDLLGTNTRFQAGLEAGRRGWL